MEVRTFSSTLISYPSPHGFLWRGMELGMLRMLQVKIPILTAAFLHKQSLRSPPLGSPFQMTCKKLCSCAAVVGGMLTSFCLAVPVPSLQSLKWIFPQGWLGQVINAWRLGNCEKMHIILIILNTKVFKRKVLFITTWLTGLFAVYLNNWVQSCVQWWQASSLCGKLIGLCENVLWVKCSQLSCTEWMHSLELAVHNWPSSTPPISSQLELFGKWNCFFWNSLFKMI